MAERLLTSPLLRFNEVREFGTGQIKQYRSAQKFRDFTFIINPRAGQVLVKGSWAKFHNQGQHNYTPYSLTDLLADIAELSALFDYDFSQGRIHGVEVGVNIGLDDLPQPYFSADYLISRFICYKGRLPFLPMKTIQGAGSGVECCLTNYRIKVYDKGTQYHRPNPILRFEYDCNQAKELLPYDIRTLADLTIPHKLDQLSQKLQDLLADCILLEPIDELRLTAAERKLRARAERPLLWCELSPRQRTYQLACFRQLTQTYSTHRLQATLRERMWQTWQQLTQQSLSIPTLINPPPNQLQSINWHKFLVISWGKRYNSFPALTEAGIVKAGGVVGWSDATHKGALLHPSTKLYQHLSIMSIKQWADGRYVSASFIHRQGPFGRVVVFPEIWSALFDSSLLLIVVFGFDWLSTSGMCPLTKPLRGPPTNKPTSISYKHMLRSLGKM